MKHFALTLGVGIIIQASWTPVASACGGLFCSSQPAQGIPQPVDQNAERIIFEVGVQNQITAHIQIQYVGGADEFAWVVPMASVPVVEESSTALFQTLDTATQLRVQMPQPQPCSFGGGGGGGGGGCGCASDDNAAGAFRDAADTNGKPPVTVYSMSHTSNYEYSVIGAEQTQDLIAWLNTNNYNVSANMIPVMDVYNTPGMKFLALKLREGRAVSDIVPIKLIYTDTRPMIPIRLTAVAAQPHMGILVFILADVPYMPDNYAFTEPRTGEIVFDQNNQTSYFEWVARATDEANGRLFIAEFVGPNPVLNQSVDGDRIGGAIVSRFYTRMSPEHMTLDPGFMPHMDPTYSASAVLDLSTQTTLFDCFNPIPERAPSACAFNYCGMDAKCTVVDGQVGCICDTDQVSQTVTGPDGQPRVVCTPRANPFSVTGTAAGEGTLFNPCLGTNCGMGTCVLKGGFPTCECGANQVACLENDGTVQCVAAPPDVVTFGPGAGPESRPTTMSSLTRGLNEEGILFAGGIWMLFASVLVWRKRKKLA